MNEQGSTNFARRPRDMDPTVFRELVRVGTIRELRKNDYGFRAGTEASEVYLLERGSVKIFGTSPEGTEMLLCVSSAGALFGLSEALRPTEHPKHAYDAIACEDSRLFVIARSQFQSLLINQPALALYIIETLSFRLDESRQRLINLAAVNMAARVARVILHMSTCYGQHVGDKAVELGVPLTQQELANVIGAARQTVNGIIQSLKADGIISVTKQHMRVENEARLRRIAMRDTGPDED